MTIGELLGTPQSWELPCSSHVDNRKSTLESLLAIFGDKTLMTRPWQREFKRS
jgi:hypothetical protein